MPSVRVQVGFHCCSRRFQWKVQPHGSTLWSSSTVREVHNGKGETTCEGENYNNSPNQFFPPPSVCEVQFVLIHHRKKKKNVTWNQWAHALTCEQIFVMFRETQSNLSCKPFLGTPSLQHAANMQPLTPETTLEERWEFLHRAVMRYCAAEVTDSQWFAALSWC